MYIKLKLIFKTNIDNNFFLKMKVVLTKAIVKEV